MSQCKARENGTQELRPVLKPKKAVPSYVHVAAVVMERGRVLLSQRPAEGLLGGMWEFPNARIDGDPAKALIKGLQAATQIQVKKKEALQVVEHAYSHFRVTVHPFVCDKVSVPKDKNLKWVKLDELEDYPMGKVDRQIARQIK
ncbi:MAG: NUDIX domain-containing protein [Chloroflexota bacterium]